MGHRIPSTQPAHFLFLIFLIFGIVYSFHWKGRTTGTIFLPGLIHLEIETMTQDHLLTNPYRNATVAIRLFGNLGVPHSETARLHDVVERIGLLKGTCCTPVMYDGASDFRILRRILLAIQAVDINCSGSISLTEIVISCDKSRRDP